MASELQDNVADNTPPSEGDDADFDEYMDSFQKLDTLGSELSRLSAALSAARNGDERIDGLMKCMSKTNHIIQLQQALLTQMHNIFLKKQGLVS